MTNVTGFSNTQKIKEEAAMWLLKIEEESPLSPEDIEVLRQWVTTSEVHREVIIRMSETWAEMDVLKAMMVPPVARQRSPWDLLRTWLLSPLLALLYVIDKMARNVFLRPRIALGSTMALALVLCVWVWLPQPTTASNLYATQLGEQANHRLADGSVLWLNSHSQVEVHYSEQYRRIRLLQGEAYFDVKKDPSRPFEVYSNNRLVRAVGTAFSVYRHDDRIEVFVSEGRVELAIVSETLVLTPDDHQLPDTDAGASAVSEVADTLAAEASILIGELRAGQSVSIPVDSDITTEIDNIVNLDAGEVMRQLSWLDGKLVFAGESLEEVVTEISRYTSMRIDVPDPVLREMRIGGHFKAGDTDALFLVLESGFGIQVNKLDEDHVELQAKK